MDLNGFKPNPGKKLIIDFENSEWARLPIKTHIITKDDNISEVVRRYAKPLLIDGDILFISERVVV
ncbi:MAG: hypothetical protein ABIJ94_04420 [candidate division WOR-3 bacterium]